MMKLNLFISYSSKDGKLVSQIAEELKQFANVTYWAESKELGEPAWQQIEAWVDNCEASLLIITDNTVRRGLSVGKEVGIIKSKNKKIIPFVSKVVQEKELNFLEGIAYERIDLNDCEESLQIIVKSIRKLYDDKQKETVEKQKTITIREQQQQQSQTLFAIAAIVIGILILVNTE